MRKLLLAGVALAGASVYLTTAAHAQSPVFPETSRPGKLDGAAPGSVQVNIGGTLFSAIEFQSGSGNSGDAKRTTPNLVGYIRLYPNFDYASPSGIHFGVSAEIRSDASAQAQNRTTNGLYWHSAAGYVSSDKFGKFSFGTPNDAIDQLGVGTGDNYGTGGFYGEYGWPHAPNFISADAYDGDVPHQKLAYYSPAFVGFTFGVSYQPNAAGLSNDGNFTDAGDGGASHNRYEVAGQFSHAFGPLSVSASAGYAGADAKSLTTTTADSFAIGPTGTVTGTPGTSTTMNFRKVSLVDLGTSIVFAGFEVEGHLDTGKFAYNGYNGAEPAMGPIPTGQKSTTAFIAGIGYTFGAAKVGAQYYGVRYDAAQSGGDTGSTAKIDGVAVGASYELVPGVQVNADFATNTNKVPTGGSESKTHGTLFAVGTYFHW